MMKLINLIYVVTLAAMVGCTAVDKMKGLPSHRAPTSPTAEVISGLSFHNAAAHGQLALSGYDTINQLATVDSITLPDKAVTLDDQLDLDLLADVAANLGTTIDAITFKPGSDPLVVNSPLGLVFDIEHGKISWNLKMVKQTLTEPQYEFSATCYDATDHSRSAWVSFLMVVNQNL